MIDSILVTLTGQRSSKGGPTDGIPIGQEDTNVVRRRCASARRHGCAAPTSQAISPTGIPTGAAPSAVSATSENVVAYGSVLTLTAPDGHKTVTGTAGTATVRKEATPHLTPANAGPAGQTLACNYLYWWTDTFGQYTFQHACGGSTAPWGYKITSAFCATLASPYVYEGGMGWSKNGVLVTIANGHYDNCLDIDHNTYLPTAKGNHISYADYFAFELANGETGDLQIFGSFILG